MNTTLADLKILLIESKFLKVSFNFPDSLLKSIDLNTSQHQIHQSAQHIFRNTGRNIEGLMIGVQKFSNCILITLPHNDN